MHSCIHTILIAIFPGKPRLACCSLRIRMQCFMSQMPYLMPTSRNIHRASPFSSTNTTSVTVLDQLSDASNPLYQNYISVMAYPFSFFWYHWLWDRNVSGRQDQKIVGLLCILSSKCGFQVWLHLHWKFSKQTTDDLYTLIFKD